jgi:hypothetical protein
MGQNVNRVSELRVAQSEEIDQNKGRNNENQADKRVGNTFFGRGDSFSIASGKDHAITRIDNYHHANNSGHINTKVGNGNKQIKSW